MVVVEMEAGMGTSLGAGTETGGGDREGARDGDGDKEGGGGVGRIIWGGGGEREAEAEGIL